MKYILFLCVPLRSSAIYLYRDYHPWIVSLVGYIFGQHAKLRAPRKLSKIIKAQAWVGPRRICLDKAASDSKTNSWHRESQNQAWVIYCTSKPNTKKHILRVRAKRDIRAVQESPLVGGVWNECSRFSTLNLNNIAPRLCSRLDVSGLFWFMNELKIRTMMVVLGTLSVLWPDKVTHLDPVPVWTRYGCLFG